MILSGKLAKGLADLLRLGSFLDAEGSVIIFLLCGRHLLSLGSLATLGISPACSLFAHACNRLNFLLCGCHESGFQLLLLQ
jgi:hypothetical protein